MSDFTYSVDADGVATLTWDVPGKSMNVMTREAFAEVSEMVDKALADHDVKGIIVTSGKDSFAGGMDLNVLARIRQEAGDNPAQALFDFTMSGHHILRKLERAGMDPKTLKGGKPVVCAIPGTCAGIGTEVALACHRRIMADNPKGKIGLPEILVGLFPGGGGTTRYSRMVGAMAAAPVLLEGKMLDPKKAKAAGLVDEVVPAGELLAKAKEWVLSASDADIVKPWDQKGWKMPGGAPYHPAGFMTFVGANAMVLGKTQGVYPAAKALLAAVYEGAMVPFDTALKIEARWFTSVLMNPSSSAMIRSLFINKEALEKGANRPAVADQRVRKVGVLGAGMMGAGIAYVSANRRDRGGADRRRARGRRPGESPRGGPSGQGHETRQGDGGEEGRGPRADPCHDRLRRAERLRSHCRGGLRGYEGQGRGDCEGRGGDPRGRDLRHQHLDPADFRPSEGVEAAGAVHRHPLLLARRQDDAGGDHQGAGDRRGGGGKGFGLRAPDQEDADRGE